jgi:hypothetical protein
MWLQGRGAHLVCRRTCMHSGAVVLRRMQSNAYVGIPPSSALCGQSWHRIMVHDPLCKLLLPQHALPPAAWSSPGASRAPAAVQQMVLLQAGCIPRNGEPSTVHAK